MKDKTAVFITTELEAVHVKLSENPDDFVTIETDQMQNTIDQNLSLRFHQLRETKS